MNVLVNGFGILDSGGVNVLEKFLEECIQGGESYRFVIMLNRNHSTQALVEKYQSNDNLIFKLCSFNTYLHRLYYENCIFRLLIARYGIHLVYNFTATTQFFLNCPQIIKIHNLLFYSKKLDLCYMKNSDYILWLRQIYFKRTVLKFMIKRSKYIEIQSEHVKKSLSEYINTSSKNFFIKSDVDVSAFRPPMKYDFSQKISFLYVVGPHFDFTHKNFSDFTGCMLKLLESKYDFAINITLHEDQLNRSKVWSKLLNPKTNFHGYINDPEKLRDLYTNNTILISTSVIETLGLHVLDGIRNGIITITPAEDYAEVVYGKRRYSYKLFDIESLKGTVSEIVERPNNIEDVILAQQKYIRENEMKKVTNVVEIFREILNVSR